ncbi:hypothetical protein HNR39_004498 [Glaciimonas immobilis]|uniref:Uncharacterized protein n=1 Tax=Glaciimonas immobilis TaxID=728004 RepID=A0A840RZV1_9BURK|nr:hypothetical protein [Glaciimonas immobilis]
MQDQNETESTRLLMPFYLPMGERRVQQRVAGKILRKRLGN